MLAVQWGRLIPDGARRATVQGALHVVTTLFLSPYLPWSLWLGVQTMS